MDEARAQRSAEREPARIRVGFIVGPTGIGKSALALEVAERLGAEVVNADSRQLYRGMDIGTAKPSADDRRRLPHHLIDVCEPDQPLDVARFGELARRAIAEIWARGRPVLVTGGSGLYLRVLRRGIFRGPAASPELRRELSRVAAARGVDHLYQELCRVDPEAAARIEPRDLYRIVRALEVYRLTGLPISLLQRQQARCAGEYETLTVGLRLERERLYAAIERRCDQMVEAGLVAEVRALAAAGYKPEAPPLSTIGYKQVAAYLRGEMSLDEAMAAAKRETRRLAKRQLTWLRHDPEVQWVDGEYGREQALALFREFFARPAAGQGG